MLPSPFARLFGMVSAPFATNNTVIRRTKLSKNRTVIRKLSFAPRSRAALSLTIAAQFLRCRGALFWLQRCDFGTVENLFSLTTAAQNIHVLFRKSPLCRSHFFEWLKAANFSTACGTSTLKSPPPRAFSVPDVHQRLRKHLSRCTLDCGFKTSESPALRGFVAERCPIRGTSLYLVLKSNGLHCPKIWLKKFGFSLKIVPANIVQKLPPQVSSQTISHHDFQLLAQTAHVCFHEQKRVHTHLRQQDRTQRLTRRNRGDSDGGAITTFGLFHTFQKPCVARG